MDDCARELEQIVRELQALLPPGGAFQLQPQLPARLQQAIARLARLELRLREAGGPPPDRWDLNFL